MNRRPGITGTLRRAVSSSLVAGLLASAMVASTHGTTGSTAGPAGLDGPEVSSTGMAPAPARSGGTAGETVDEAGSEIVLASGRRAMAPSTYERQVQYWINRRRDRHDLPQLRLAACTDRVAERWTRHLVESDLFEHQSMETLLRRCRAYYAGETLGRGWSMSPHFLVKLWMRSPGHRKVLLNPVSRRVGVGAVQDSTGRWVVTANFMRF